MQLSLTKSTTSTVTPCRNTPRVLPVQLAQWGLLLPFRTSLPPGHLRIVSTGIRLHVDSWDHAAFPRPPRARGAATISRLHPKWTYMGHRHPSSPRK
jgi:hypothetical protein